MADQLKANFIRGRTFHDEEVVLDFNKYEGCTFNSCTLIYHGLGSTGLDGCQINASIWVFVGPAENTLEFLIGIRDNLTPTEEGESPVIGIARQLIGDEYEITRRDGGDD